MGLKTKIGMAMATSAAGAAMVVGGSFALFSDAKYTNSGAFTTGTLSIDAPGQMSAGSLNVSNMAPGDTATQSFTIRNTGSLDEWIDLETSPTNGVKQHSIWESFANSIDADAGNAIAGFHGLGDQQGAGSAGTAWSGSDFTTDNHPATYGYTVVVHGAGGSTSTPVTLDQLSGDQWNYQHPFMLRRGEYATVTYSVTLPLAAHNDYQDTDGKLNVEVDAVQVRNNWYHTTGSDQSRQQGDVPAGTSDAWPFSWQPDVHQ